MSIKKAFIFPGQGSQTIAMGKDFFDNFNESKAIFQEVDEVLSQNLSKLIFEGPLDTLSLTVNTQPALMAVSMAILKALEKQNGLSTLDMCSFVAGHSLGEYTALCASKAISLADTARLLRVRGNAMQDAVPLGVGSMAAILGASTEEVEQICFEAGEICEIANDNSVGQIVISGSASAIDKACEISASKGKKAIKLNVSAPFHCSLMFPAAEIMKDALQKQEIQMPVVPLVANVTADVANTEEEIRNNLVTQVAGRVKWRQSIEKMIELGVTEFVEIGAGKVLCGMIKRINKDVKTSAINNIVDLK